MSTRLNTVTLQLGRQESEVWVNASLSDAARVQLSVGWANVLPGPLRTSPPRPIDLEIAIQNIEEHVMPLARMVPVGASLRISYVGDSVQSLLPFIQGSCRLDDIEAVFSRLCAIAEGSPAEADAQLIEPAAVASLLIVRELMQHSRLAEVLIA